jgi:hypothetical protein
MAPAPKVNVKIPDVKLRLEDLAYLRSLGREDGIRCSIPRHHLDRLRLLGLVKIGTIPPTAKVREDAQKRIVELKAEAHRLMAAGEWERLSSVAWQLKGENSRLAPTKNDVLSALGRDLLEKGSVMVMMAKGCGK